MDRKKKIIELLEKSNQPVKGSELSQKLKVSRQTLVQDIAWLRKDGFPVISTTHGYILDSEYKKHDRGVLGIIHTPEQLKQELEILIAHHVTVADVFIHHPIYGRISGELNIRTPKDIKVFLEKRGQSTVPLFSEVTGGLHYHTLLADDKEYIDDAKAALRDAGFEVIE
ncbi:transcription repressor NadR [Microaerobacter geothermalis]|uniref:transcription repressor NadR n=1 Tax=Microaerobacter geothermalis TaxID=674972 RepID=UPI001F1D0B93|nr:transcription repressor NadR [Microaerobacter geothermalis]MCF6093080.1 transcription repressor NadR [Microaerobacter geothermalis]